MKFELQRSFSSGELSPLIYMRNDLGDVYDNGVSELSNMYPDPRGPALCRSGSEFIEEAIGETSGKLVEFGISSDNIYPVIIGDNQVWINDPTAKTIDTGTELVTNPDFVTPAGAGWTDYDPLVPSNFGLAGIAQIQTDGALTGGIYQLITPPTPNIDYVITVKQVVAAAAPHARITILATSGGDSINFISDDTPVARLAFNPGASINFNLYILIDPANNGLIAKMAYIDSVTMNPAVSITPGDKFAKFPSPYSVSNLENIQYEMAPGKNKLFIVSKGVTPFQIENISNRNIWSAENIIFFGNTTTIFSAGINEEFPGVLGFHQSRFIIADIASGGNAILMSKPGEYENFELGDPTAILADDAISATTLKNGVIKWIKSNEQLFIGMDNSEHVITAQGAILATSDLQIDQQSEYGSKNLKAVIAEGQLAYVDSRGKKLRFLQYNDIIKKWASLDVSLYAEHIVENIINELKFSAGKYSIFLLTLNNGDYATCIVENNGKTVGWSKHNTQGNILSTSIILENGETIIYLLVSRTNGIYFERIDPNNIIEYMDSFITQTGLVSSTITGLAHLEGETVQILADGVVHKDLVVSSGQITLDYVASTVIVGLSYLPRLKSIPANKEFQEGNDFMHTKTYSSIGVKLYDCHRPIVNGIDTFERFPSTPMGSPEPPRTELVIIGNQNGYTQDAYIDIYQEKPLRLNIAAIGGKYTINKV